MVKRALAGLVLLTAHPVFAQAVVTSPMPDAVSVTVYRDPERSGGGEIDLEDLSGFALITETRRISVPAGAATIRFEGVAGGIIPVSAIVTGLPGGVIQKNRDANLLSPAALVDGSLGRRVHLKRTNRKTGVVSEDDAEIIAGPVGGVIVRSKAGIEALRCSGLPETLLYDGVPAGLVATPTLSVETRSPVATTASVQLSYLASGFDWSANYVARVSENGKTLDLFAWLTLANSNGESFVEANTQAVAGTLNRDDDAADLEQDARVPELQLACWGSRIEAPAPPPAPVAADFESANEIIVTAQRRSVSFQSVPVAISAVQEELGDLKLYRIPEPVTVAANAQKQVAMIQKSAVPFARFYTARLYPNNAQEPEASAILLRMKNTSEKGLGLPMPAGGVALFEPGGGTQLLVGETRLRDTAVGEDVELTIGKSAQVQIELTDDDSSASNEARNIGRYNVKVSNANPAPVVVEVRLIPDADSYILRKASARLTSKNGDMLWTVRVPANGNATLRYELHDVK